MCLYPKLIRNPKYKSTKKNGGNIPPITDERVTWVPIGCQNCKECRKQKARSWQVRLLEDIKTNTNGKFITLTFTDDYIAKLINGYTDEESGKWVEGVKGNPTGYNLDNAIATLAMRRFNERYRKKYGKALRHWMVTEIGHNGTENIHLHGIIWTDCNMQTIEKLWKYGWVWKGKKEHGKIINYVGAKTVNYIIKYVTKLDLKHKHYKSIILTSPGIGKNYTSTWDAYKNKYVKGKTQEAYRTATGHKINMPIYWRNKIYTEEEREKLWLEKLDKEERWVCGEKISVKNGLDKYNALVAYYRRINTQLGYGNDEKKEEELHYQNAQRMLMQKTRIAKAKARERKVDLSEPS